MPTPTEHEAILSSLARIEATQATILAKLTAMQTAQTATTVKLDDTQALILQIQRSL